MKKRERSEKKDEGTKPSIKLIQVQLTYKQVIWSKY